MIVLTIPGHPEWHPNVQPLRRNVQNIIATSKALAILTRQLCVPAVDTVTQEWTTQEANRAKACLTQVSQARVELSLIDALIQ